MNKKRREIDTKNAEFLFVSWCFEPSQPQRITSGVQKVQKSRRQKSWRRRSRYTQEWRVVWCRHHVEPAMLTAVVEGLWQMLSHISQGPVQHKPTQSSPSCTSNSMSSLKSLRHCQLPCQQRSKKCFHISGAVTEQRLQCSGSSFGKTKTQHVENKDTPHRFGINAS